MLLPQLETQAHCMVSPTRYDPIVTARADTERSSLSPVMDLPQLYSKPSAETLLSALAQLAIAPQSFSTNSDESSNAPTISEDGIASYLTRVVSSSFTWIDSDPKKEEIWEAASARLSERAGRTARSSSQRVFRIPIPNPSERHTSSLTEILINIHEPSLTGDNLGHKTWAASYMLAKRLPNLLPQHFPSVDFRRPTSPQPYQPPDRPRVLELGAGTGLVGLAVSGMFSVQLRLTDLPAILPNLQRNVAESSRMAVYQGGTISADVLDWSEPICELGDDEKYDVILAADSLYAPEHAGWLANVMSEYSMKEAKARVFIELPLRPNVSYPEDLREEMHKAGFEVLEEGEEVGYDDWHTCSGEGIEVACWWSVWGWA